MPFDAEGREYPYFDEETLTKVVGHYGDWMVSVSPMIFNDRVVLTHRSGYPLFVAAGFCYDKGGAATLAAYMWNPEETARPLGYKKVAYDEREAASGEADRPSV